MDTSFRSMYLGLSAFLSANKDRRDLLLSQRQPEFDVSFDPRIAVAPDDFSRITLKAQAAKDYFLLVGPPGTGKTSRALRGMVEAFYREGSRYYCSRTLIVQWMKSAKPSLPLRLRLISSV